MGLRSPTSNTNAGNTFGYDLSGSINPTIYPVDAPQGATYMLTSNPVGFYQKLDNGPSTNWLAISGPTAPVSTPSEPVLISSSTGQIVIENPNEKVIFLSGTAAVAPPAGTPGLGTARSYAALAGTEVVSTGDTVLTGNLGVAPGNTATGFPPGTVSGNTDLDDAASIAAQGSAAAAYADLSTRVATNIPSILDGQVLTAGVYKTLSGSATLGASGPGTLTLNGSSTDVFVIQLADDFTMGEGGIAEIVLIGGALACNVYFAVGGTASINVTEGSIWNGNLIAVGNIVVGEGSVTGSVISTTGSITLDVSDISVQALNLGGPVTVTTDPPIYDPYGYVGKMITIVGESATNATAVTLQPGANFQINGDWVSLAAPTNAALTVIQITPTVDGIAQYRTVGTQD